MRHLLSSTRDLVINRAAQPILAFLLVVIIGRMGSDLLGAYTVVTVWFVILQTLPMLGLAPLLMRELSLQPDRAGEIVGSSVALGMGVSALLCLVVPAILPLVPYPHDVKVAIILVALSMFPSVVIFVSELHLVTATDTVPIGLVSLVENVFRIGASLVVLWLGGGVPALLVPVLVGRIGAAAWYLRRLRRTARPLSVSAGYVRKLLRECPIYVLNSLVFLVVSRADFVFLSLAVSRAAVAHYAVAYKFLEFGLLLATAFTGAVFPHLARASEGDDWNSIFSRLAVRSTKLLLLVMIPACLGLYLNAGGLVLLLFPKQYPQAVPLLRLLVLALFLSSFKSLSSAILFSTSRPRADLVALSIGSASYVALLALFVPKYGVTGAAIASLAEAAIQTGAYLVAVARHYTKQALRLERIPGLALVALLLGAAGFMADRFAAGPLARLAASVAIAAFFILLVVQTRILRQEELAALGIRPGTLS